MKRVVITCDRCGKEIHGYPMKLSAEYVARTDEKPVVQAMPTGIRRALERDCERDYCEECMQEILEFAHKNMDAETFKEEQKEAEIDEAVESLTGQKLRKKMSAGKREKIEQLYASGVKETDIAMKLGIDLYVVKFIVEQIKKAG